MRLVHIGLASVNTTVGAFRANVDRAVALATEMEQSDVTIALFPEQLVGGYPQEDLVQWQAFVSRQWAELERFALATAHLELASCIGVGIAHNGLRYNCAALVRGGKIWGLVPKEKLPTYSILYEGRTVARGYSGMDAQHRGVPLGDLVFAPEFGRLALEVCEDLWSADGPIRRRCYAGAELVCNLSASPYRLGVDGTRRELVASRAGDHQCTIAYVNKVGGQDGLIFDGGGFVNQNGQLALELDRFRQGWKGVVVDLDKTLRLRTENTTWREDQRAAGPQPVRMVPVGGSSTRRARLAYPVPDTKSFFLPRMHPQPSPREKYCEELLDALALGLGDYFEKVGSFRAIGVSLSGGRDSMLTLLIAHRFAARAKVPLEAFSMPSRHTSAHTREAARTIADELHIGFTEVSIDEAYDREVAAVTALAHGSPSDITLQNVQARIRASRMWNWANAAGGLFLQTGNMSEKAFGYTTVGGDLMGGLAVIANLPKTVVNYLLEYLHESRGYRGIALALAQPAGPELKANQKGEDEMMPFPILDACFYLFASEKLAPPDIVTVLGTMFPELAKETMERQVARFVRAFCANVYKWVQSPVSLHVGNLDLDRERALQMPVVTKMQW